MKEGELIISTSGYDYTVDGLSHELYEANEKIGTFGSTYTTNTLYQKF